MQFERGDIVRAQTPHTDLSGTSQHPALIVADPMVNASGDYILIQITSSSYNSASDYTLQSSDPEFSMTGLQNTSTFRCHKMFPLKESLVRKKFGKVGPNTMKEIEDRRRALLCL